MDSSHGLDAHAKPPPGLRDVYKRFQRLDAAKLAQEHDLLDLSWPADYAERLSPCQPSAETKFCAEKQFCSFLGRDDIDDIATDCQAFEVLSMPGLFIYPSFFPPSIQSELLERLLHRDLSNPSHQTNLHLHYNVPYLQENALDQHASYFDSASPAMVFAPKDPAIHRPLTVRQSLDKKLRWMTLGGQYDWTRKLYPEGRPPAFPPDIKALIERLFPLRAEAAIVNLYSPGDTLSLHRDVSEECAQPLLSVSIGCDAVFLVGVEGSSGGSGGGEERSVAMRLRSGDAVLMSGESRYAWHGVPKVLGGTCPSELRDWPYIDGGDGRFVDWKGWMSGKRINVNVRQMFD